MNVQPRKRASVRELRELRLKLARGASATQDDIEEIAGKLQEFRSSVRPNEKNETFPLVDARGLCTGVTAPRWVCHFLDLRHTVVHVLLRWASNGLGDVYLFQVRSWDSSVSPGHVDISVGGHVTDLTQDVTGSAYREMREELGITREELAPDQLQHVGGYEWNEEREAETFYNSEWREVFTGEITQTGFERIKFDDREVVGLYLCPVSEADNLLHQTRIPLGSALRHSLPKCLAR